MADKPKLIERISLIVSLLALGCSFYVLFRTELNTGQVKILFPSTGGMTRGILHSNKSDKILLSFVIFNDGTRVRTLREIELELTDEKGGKWDFKALGEFDKLKDLNVKENNLTNNRNYALMSAYALQKYQSAPVNLLFFYKHDGGWSTRSPDKPQEFKLEAGKYYNGQIYAEVFDEETGTNQIVRSFCFGLSPLYLPTQNYVEISLEPSPQKCPK